MSKRKIGINRRDFTLFTLSRAAHEWLNGPPDEDELSSLRVRARRERASEDQGGEWFRPALAGRGF